MKVREETVERMKDGVKTMVSVADNMMDKVPEELDKLIKVLEDRNTEVRLKFDHLTLDGDIALSLSLFKRGDKASSKK